jgi:hypothetical protein
VRHEKTAPALVLVLAICLILPLGNVCAQGSITGFVHNTDLSVPLDGSVLFFGLINNTDKEIRIQSCIGAGYESGHWYDDFQNYLTEAPGLPYYYYFFDTTGEESALLQKTIPSNSYQVEDISLTAGSYPQAAAKLEAAVLDNNTVRLDWTKGTGVTWHIYRRDGSSRGSFFRIDNPAGNRSDPGVSTAHYVDDTVDSLGQYYYMVIGEGPIGTYSPPSEVIFVNVTSCCQGHVGDINGIGGDQPTLGDVVVLIDILFISNKAPLCLEETDVNQSGGLHPTTRDISVGDVSTLIDHLFISLRPLRLCTDAAR